MWQNVSEGYCICPIPEQSGSKFQIPGTLLQTSGQKYFEIDQNVLTHLMHCFLLYSEKEGGTLELFPQQLHALMYCMSSLLAG